MLRIAVCDVAAGFAYHIFLFLMTASEFVFSTTGFSEQLNSLQITPPPAITGFVGYVINFFKSITEKSSEIYRYDKVSTDFLSNTGKYVVEIIKLPPGDKKADWGFYVLNQLFVLNCP